MQNSVENPQCNYFVKRKKRLCRMTVRPGRSYCGEHEPEPTLESGELGTRIACPLDPKHTCYAIKLEKHLQICNARQTEVPAYIVHNVNSAVENTDEERKPLSEISKPDLYAVIGKVNRLYDEIISNSISAQPPAPIHPVVIQEYNEPDRGDNSRRHLHQVSALMKMMQDEGLVQDNHCYVELGAGKGHLSYYICMAWCKQNSSRTVMIDRAALRHKRDNKLKETREEGRVTRIRADLAHLSLPDVDAVKGSSGVVGFAKHLCGVASDLALRCVSESRMLDKTKGVVLATCCHHRCVFSTYVGRKYLWELGITTSDFNIMLGIVSWYTCGDGLSREQRSSQANELTNRQAIELTSREANDITNRQANELTSRQANELTIRQANELTKRQANENKQAYSILQTSNIQDETELNENREAKENSKINNNSLVEKTTPIINIKLKSEFNNTDLSNKINENSPLQMTREDKEEVGRRAKILIDWGRVEFLKSCGFEARLCHFVSTNISLENVCIVAKSKS